MTSYLLGELPEPDAGALEREFFENPDVFARLVQAETALVDDYVRRRLPPHLKSRFEQHYLSNPRRRSRVEFADALAVKIDEEASADEPRVNAVGPSRQDALFSFSSGWTWRVSIAAALGLLVVSTGWLLIQSARLRDELTRSEMARTRGEQRASDLQGQLSSAQTTARDLASELERLKSVPAPQTPAAPATPSFVSLLLRVPSVRSPEPSSAPTLTMPPATREVRIELAMDDAEYASYQVSLNSVAGPSVYMRQHLAPRRMGAGARVSLTVPAARLVAGDYVLTLSGERPGAQPETVSELLFRIVTVPNPR
jgi:hypothetical protein